MSAPSGPITPEAFEAMMNYPGAVPPPGVIPNLVNPYSRGKDIIIVGSILLAIMSVFVTLRYYTKAFIIKSATWDDLSLAFGAVLTGAFFAISCAGVLEGPIGKHQWDVTLRQLTSSILTITVSYAGFVVMSLALLCTKLTLFLMYYHLFRPLKWLRMLVWIGGTINVLLYISCMIAYLVLAAPAPGETWVTHALNPKIQQTAVIEVPMTAVGLAIDLLLFAMPFKAIESLHMPKKRKIGVGATFLAGVLAIIASILSLVYRSQILHSPDQTWVTVDVAICTLVELYIGVIIACVPSVPRLVKHVKGVLTTKGSKSSYQYQTPTKVASPMRKGISDDDTTPANSAQLASEKQQKKKNKLFTFYQEKTLASQADPSTNAYSTNPGLSTFDSTTRFGSSEATKSQDGHTPPASSFDYSNPKGVRTTIRGNNSSEGSSSFDEEAGIGVRSEIRQESRGTPPHCRNCGTRM